MDATYIRTKVRLLAFEYTLLSLQVQQLVIVGRTDLHPGLSSQSGEYKLVYNKR